MNTQTDISKEFNVASKLAEFALTYPDKKIIIFPEKSKTTLSYHTLTYGQLQERVNRLAYSLSSLGLKKGDRAVVMVPMSIDLYVIIIALLTMGATTVFIDPWVGKKQIIRCCTLTQPRGFFGIRKAHLLRLLSHEVRKIPIKVIVGSRSLFAERNLGDLIKRGKGEFQTVPVRKGDTALITFTTGSTGTPKGANRTHAFLLAQQKVLSESIPMSQEDIDLPGLPIFVLKNLAHNVSSVIPLMDFMKPTEVEPSLIVQQIKEWNVTTCVGSPAFFERIADYCLEKNIKLEKIRALYTGGGPVTPELIDNLSHILPNGTPYIVYGSTEAEPISLLNAEDITQETGKMVNEGYGNCVGKPVKDIEVRILEPTEGPIDFEKTDWKSLEKTSGSIGEIVVTGEHVNKEYYKNPTAVRENKFTDERGRVWHRTGDAGYIDKRGRIWLVGRVKNRITKDGKDFYPLQIEPLIDNLPSVRRSGLVAVSQGSSDKKILVFIEVTDKGGQEREKREHDIKDVCKRKGLEIDGVVQIEKIPVDPRHHTKIDYEKLKKFFKK
jgi:acyl-CoA synthetase (AMP-forming)/AMP-acid ligase II